MCAGEPLYTCVHVCVQKRTCIHMTYGLLYALHCVFVVLSQQKQTPCLCDLWQHHRHNHQHRHNNNHNISLVCQQKKKKKKNSL